MKQMISLPMSKPIYLVALGLMLVALLTGCNRATNHSPPGGFEPLAEANLATRSFSAEALAEFTLEEMADVAIFYTIPNIDTGVFDLSLKGSDEGSIVILRSEDFRTDENGGGMWEQRLPADVYQLVLTASQTPGTLSVYWTSK